MSQKWSLGNRRENTVENNLYLASVAQKIIILLQNDDDHSISENLFVWTVGWSAWKNYSEVSEICNEIDLLNEKAAEAPPPLDFSSAPPLPTSIPKVFNNTATPEKKTVSKEKDPLFFHKKEIINQAHSAQTPAKPNSTVYNPTTANRSNATKPKSSKTTIHNAHGGSDHHYKHITQMNTPASTASVNAVAASNSDVQTKKPLPNPKRKHTRIFARFKCIIRSSSLTFRTFTHDISLGGVSLEDEIPADLIGIECMIYISSTKTHNHLKFKIAPTERCVAKYFSFQDADQEILKELSEWLEAHQKISSAS